MFPALDITQTTLASSSNDELPTFREVLIDFLSGEPVMVNGNFQIVEKNEALKVWAWKAINTERYKYPGYSWNYGAEIEKLIGQGYSRAVMQSEIERILEECLLVNPYITGITNISFSYNGSEITYKYSLETIYEDEESEED